MKEFRLNNDVIVPSVGLGTFLLEPKDAENSVRVALLSGYQLIDTANAYCNEVSVGRGIKASGVKREDVFISTKLWANEYENPHAVEDTLNRLGVDYLDLLFIHQPTSKWREGYKQLIKAYKEGKIRSIGVSNFEGKYIKELLKEFDIIPQVIQVECHPFFPQDELRTITEPLNIRIMSWFPLGGKGKTGDLLNNPIVVELANKYHKSPAQIVLKWHTQMGFIVIPGSKNADHIKENIDIFDFSLTEEDMKQMSKLNVNERRHHMSEESLKRYEAYIPTYEK